MMDLMIFISRVFGSIMCVIGFTELAQMYKGIFKGIFPADHPLVPTTVPIVGGISVLVGGIALMLLGFFLLKVGKK